MACSMIACASKMCARCDCVPAAVSVKRVAAQLGRAMVGLWV
jgi:hypothetical protein